MKKIEWHIKNQNAKYKFSENLSKESSINISKEIFEFLGAKESGEIITVTLRKKDFLLAFSKLISTLPLYYYRNGSQKAELNSEFFESNYNEIVEHFGDSESIQYQVKVRINDESTTRYYLYRIDGAKNFILRDFLIGENSSLNFIKTDSGEIIVEPVINVAKAENLLEVNETELNDAQNKLSPTATPHTKPKQIIFYGVPGCGKSHKISKMLEDSEQFTINSAEEQIVRTVFHPDYTNSDFVGQIMPKVNGEKIEYNFVPGPFSKILARALKHSENQYVLIIEEINRGNAAAIFGEIFQLLDRIKSGQTTKEKLRDGAINNYGEGWSEYFFMNDDINHYILRECNGADNFNSVNVNGITFSENTGIRLPPNLSILATMNTSDQNVFTLDNAFQRRWNMEYISNKIDTNSTDFKGAVKNQYESVIGDTGVQWGRFRDEVNKAIADPENSFSNAEDKQLGLFFIHADCDINERPGKIDETDFSNKVLKYLWNDIFKRDKSAMFADGIETFGDLLDKFKRADAIKNCFSPRIADSL